MSEENLQVINTLLEKIQKARPLSKLERRELEKSLQVEFTYNSNAIEGNTITRGETKILLEDGLTIGGHTLRELHETTNHKNIFPLLKCRFFYRYCESKSPRLLSYDKYKIEKFFRSET